MSRNPNNLKYIAILTTLMWSVLFYIIIISHFSYSPVQLSKTNKDVFFKLYPQGWSFFTKNPRYERLEIYEVIDKELHRLTNPNFSSANIFGFSRINRQLLNESLNSLGDLTRNDSIWLESKDPPLLVFDQIQEVYGANNRFPNPHLCGTYLFVKYEPIPWAWSSNSTYQTNKGYLLVYISCNSASQ